MRKFTDKEILDRVSQLHGFRGFPDGVMDVWIRSADDAFDRFDDRAFTYECLGARRPPRFIMWRYGTTNAGSFGLLHFEKYNSQGCAVLASDEIVYESHVYGRHRGKPAYIQVKPFPYYRDADRDHRAEENGPPHHDIIGANVHRAGSNSRVINNWSTACLVTSRQADFQQWMRFMKKRPLTVCILKEWAR